jgi:hypothetical protein
MTHALVRCTLRIALVGWSGLAGFSAWGQPEPLPADAPLFAVEITVGPKWDPNKPPQEQAFFREHSQNLKRLREAGALVVGARYADKGLVVVAARDEGQARAMMEEDASIRAGIFNYQLHPFSVFYGGTIRARPVPPRP